MNFSFFETLYMPLVLSACLILGYCIKHISWLERISNEYIPTILAVTGAVLGCIYAGTVSFEVIVAGAASGLASTGMHQAFSAFLKK